MLSSTEVSERRSERKNSARRSWLKTSDERPPPLALCPHRSPFVHTCLWVPQFWIVFFSIAGYHHLTHYHFSSMLMEYVYMISVSSVKGFVCACVCVWGVYGTLLLL